MSRYILSLKVLLLLVCIQRFAEGLTCLSCNNVRLPSECSHVQTCGFTEQCAVQKVAGGRYNTGCVSRNKCTGIGAQTIIGRRDLSTSQTQECLQCCDLDRCNNVGCGSEEEECKKHLNKGYFYDSSTKTCAKVVKSSTAYNHSEADANCKQDGATMVSIDNENKQYFLLSWIYTHFKNADFWIGLSKNTSDGYRFHWQDDLDHKPLNYDNWGRTYSKQPSDNRTGNENCVYLDAEDSYLWHDGQCDVAKAGYICEIWNISNIDLATHCRRKVFQGYLYDSTTNMCFKLKDNPTARFSYDAAAADCAVEDGATLARINSEHRTDLIRRWIYSNQANVTNFWIGLRDVTNTSTFAWTDGTILNDGAQFTNWGGPDVMHIVSTQPDHRHGSENCVYMSKDFNYKWFDERCDERKNGFICQHFGRANVPGDGCFELLSKGYFYDVHTNLCVKMFTDGSWDRDNAFGRCQDEGDSLLEIDSHDKDIYIQYLVRSLGHHGNTDFWIGAQYANTGDYRWPHYLSTSMAYTNWYHNTQKPKNCVILDHTDQYRWAPKECDYAAQGFICQLDAEALGKLAH